MITKDQLAASMIHECHICQHLFTKLGPNALAYRPSSEQRTTLELLRYLAICGIAGIRCMAAGDWKLFSEYTARVKDMTAEEFPAMMGRQAEELTAFFASVSEETLETHQAPVPGGSMVPLGMAILSGPFKWLTGYKLQLFLYAKASGATELGTANVWAGVDRPAPASP